MAAKRTQVAMASAALALLLAVLGSSVVASPVWMPQFLTGGSGRNIRHLPCVSRRTAEQGVCMFALSCSRANGTHLGTCIDRFYFGSCCKMEGSLNNEENTLAAFPPSVTLATTAPPLDAPLSTFQTVNGNGIDETLSTASYTTAPTRAPAPPHSTQFASSAHTSGASPTPGSSTTPSKPPPSPPPVPTKPLTLGYTNFFISVHFKETYNSATKFMKS
ncbi:Serine proteinase stubble [Gryllus bimaculatus]|nr:Serine proteinase stubble [Gryllus bimaculatus]